MEGSYDWAEKATVDGVDIGQGGRLKNLTTGSLQNLTYKYDEAGNVPGLQYRNAFFHICFAGFHVDQLTRPALFHKT